MNGLSLSLLDKVNELYLITMLSVPALYEAKRTIGGLIRAGLAEDRLRIIVNEVGATQVSGSELNGLFGVPVYAKLPDAARELDDACAQGQLLGEGSPYRVQIAALARRVAGLPEEKSGGPASQLRYFVGMFHRNVKASRVQRDLNGGSRHMPR
jgi:Flp pilus assembly CpaE family ATPase